MYKIITIIMIACAHVKLSIHGHTYLYRVLTKRKKKKTIYKPK